MKPLVVIGLLACSCTAPAVAESLPLVVVLHGYGSTPDDVKPLVDDLGVRITVLAPHGETKAMSGWSWFSSPRTTSEAEFETGLRSASDSIAQQIVELERKTPTCGRPIVVGFSQGGFLSYALAARPTSVVGLALPLAGYLPAALRPTTKPRAAPTVVALHGDSDPRVEIAWDRATLVAFTSLGFTASIRAYPGVGHAVSPEMRNDVRRSIVDYVRAEGCAR